GKRWFCDEGRRGGQRRDYRPGGALTTISERRIFSGIVTPRFRGILALAYRTPPVRGEDRVHLRDFKKSTFITNLLTPQAADHGHDHPRRSVMAARQSKDHQSKDRQSKDRQSKD